MGFLIMEKDDLLFKYEEVKFFVDEVDFVYRCDLFVYVFVLVEVKKWEESLKKDVGVVKECIFSVSFFF